MTLYYTIVQKLLAIDTPNARQWLSLAYPSG
jgi:hypothetical protein